MTERNPGVDHYFAEGCGRCSLGGTPECKVHSWQKEMKLLRNILLDCGLTEEVKWGVPCYTLRNKNVVILSALKEYCALSFFKGALLKDEAGILEKPGVNTQAARLIRFTGNSDIPEMEALLKAYVFEAMEVEKAGLEVHFKEKNELVYPEELVRMMEENPDLKSAFEALTPGKKRGYILHFSAPKQSQTRISRIEKCLAKILNGKGFHER